MCKAMELHDKEMKIEGAIEGYRDIDMPDEEIAERVAKKFDVTVEYVKELMLLKAV